MTPNIERLTKLRDHLLHGQLGHEQFDFMIYHWSARYATSSGFCGSAGCAIGECPFVWPDEWQFAHDKPVLKQSTQFRSMLNPQNAGAEFFGLTDNEFSALFVPNDQDFIEYITLPELESDATKEQVAANLTTFIEYHQKQNG